MKVLFSTNSLGFLRNFQSTVRLLAERGHEVHLYAERTDTVDGQKIADTLAAELKAAESALKSEQAEIARERQALDAERVSTAADLQRTTEERVALAARVNPEALAIFERIAHGRKGQAMAEAREGLCTVCHVRLRPQIFNQARRNDSIIQCDSCTRILYFVPVPTPVAPEQAS